VSGPVVAVIGAGNVGCALAGDLALRGVDVRLFNRSPGRLEPIREAGGITVTGEVEGFGQLSAITETLAEAVDGAEVVAVTLPTSSLPVYAAELVDTTTDGQVIWLDPGHSGGGLYLAAEIRRRRDLPARRLCQLTTASHISRMSGPATVRVFLRARAAVSALPARDLEDCYARLDALLPGQFGRAATVLETDLMNINAILHPPGMVCNAGWIEATAGDFGFYADGNGPAVARVMEALDRERVAIAERLGVPTVRFADLLYQLGFSNAGPGRHPTAHEAIESSELIHPIQAPPTLDHRYLHEDVGWGLVPWMHLAAAAGCPTPMITALTHLAGVITGTDYSCDGLTLERMGLAGKTAEEIRAHMRAPDHPIA
jgi:opine dehydrogenase